MVKNNLLMLVSVVALCLLPRLLLALPITSKPFANNPDHLVWDLFSGGDSLDPSSDGYEKPKKILPKSIFIAPTRQNTLPNTLTTCGPMFTRDHLGNCIETVQINHKQVLENQLALLLFQHKQQRPTQEDTYDYDYDEPATSPTPPVPDFPKGPFQLTLPAQFESAADSPPALSQSPDPNVGSSLGPSSFPSPVTTTPGPTTTTPAVTTTKRPVDPLTELLEELISKDPFGLLPKLTSVRPTMTTVVTTTSEPMETTTNPPTTVVVAEEEEEEENTTNVDNGVTMSYEQEFAGNSQRDVSSWSTSEFATELAREQLVPVTATTTWEQTTSDADLLLSNAEGTTTYEVATESQDDSHSNGGIGTAPTTSFSSTPPPPSTTGAPEVTETVLPVQVTEKRPLPTVSSLFGSSSGGFDWSRPIAIVTPVSNPFSFQKSTFGSTGSSSSGGSLFKFTAPATTTPRSTTTRPPTPSASSEAPPTVPELLLPVENESENSHKMRESLIESEQKEMNYENIDANNRFVYHHLNSVSTTEANSQRQTSSTGVQPQGAIQVAEQLRTMTPDERTRVPEKLVAHRRFKESERLRGSSSVATPPTTRWTYSSVTTTPKSTEQSATPFSFSTGTTSKFEQFLRESSNRIRFPGPSVNRQPAPNKLIPSGQTASRTGAEKEKKPFWWFPANWEVDTKQKEKPVLLRFWNKMPLIPDSATAATQRRPHSHHGGRNNRENSKSPSDNLYREVAFQDISRAFQERRLNGGSQ